MMKKWKRWLALCVACACLLLPINGTLWSAGAADGDLTEYAPTGVIGKAANWPALNVEDLPGGAVRIAFDNASSPEIRTTCRQAYGLDGLHMRIENFTGDGIGVQFVNTSNASAYSTKGLRFMNYRTGKVMLLGASWGTAYGTFELKNPLGDTLDIRFSRADEDTWLYTINGEEIEVPHSLVEEAVEDMDRVYVLFNCAAVGYAAGTFRTASIDLVSLHGGESLCLDQVGDSLWDGDYYPPSTSAIKDPGYWKNNLSVSELPFGGVRVAFTNSNSANIRTTGGETYQLDGLHISIRNFTGDGIGLTISNAAAPTAVDKGFRFLLYRSTAAETPKGALSTVSPAWSGTFSHTWALDRELPSSLDLTFERDTLAGGWKVTCNQQIFVLTAEEMSQSVEDTDEVYISFHQWYGTYMATSSFDVAAIHGGDKPCVSKMSAQQLKAVQFVVDSIAAIGTVEASGECGRRIETAQQALDALKEELIPLVINRDMLKAAVTQYYLLTHSQPEFDEEHITYTFGVVSDMQIGGFNYVTAQTGTSADRFRKALKILNGKNINALIMAGDLTESAAYSDDKNKVKGEIAQFRRLIEDNLSDDVDIFYCLGNHDSSNGSGAALYAEELGDRFFQSDSDKKEAAENGGNRHQIYGGYHFLSVECDYSLPARYTDATLDWVKSTLDGIVKDPAYNGEPLFVVTHSPVAGTTYGGGMDTARRLGEVLSNYPQVVLFAGHIHNPLNDERCIMQGDFTAIDTGTMYYLGVESAGYTPDGGDVNYGGLRPSDAGAVSQGLYVEMDRHHNMRVTRLDFYRGGQVIKNAWVVPAPDLKNKTHLLHYTEARGAGKTAPVFPKNSVLTAEATGEGEVLFTIPQARDTDMVHHYVIEMVKDGETVSSIKCHSGWWRYPQAEDWPKSVVTEITGITVERPYTVRVTAVDSWGNRSEPLTCTVGLAGEADREAAARVDGQIRALGTAVTLDSREALEAARAAYEALTYDQKNLSAAYEELLRAEKAYRDLFVYLDQYFYAPNQYAVVNSGFWDALKTAPTEEGIHVAFTESPSIDVRTFCEQTYALDGLHILIRNFSGGGLGLTIGNQYNSSAYDNDGLRLLNAANGSVKMLTARWDGTVEQMEQFSPLETTLDIRFKKLDDGNWLYSLNAESMVLDAEFIARVIDDPEHVYVLFFANPWSAPFFTSASFDVIGIHSGADTCYGESPVVLAMAEEALAVAEKIRNIGMISLDSQERIEAAEAAYRRLDDSVRLLVDNYGDLAQARAILDELIREAQEKLEQDRDPDDPTTDNPHTGRMASVAALLVAAGMAGTAAVTGKRKRRS